MISRTWEVEPNVLFCFLSRRYLQLFITWKYNLFINRTHYLTITYPISKILNPDIFMSVNTSKHNFKCTYRQFTVYTL